MHASLRGRGRKSGVKHRGDLRTVEKERPFVQTWSWSGAHEASRCILFIEDFRPISLRDFFIRCLYEVVHTMYNHNVGIKVLRMLYMNYRNVDRT